MNVSTINEQFLRQAGVDAWKEYEYACTNEDAVTWDYLVLTASNEDQAENYRVQIAGRLEEGRLPRKTRYMVLSDPDGKRVGSGGATFNVLKYVAEQEIEERQNTGETSMQMGNPFAGKRVLVIHSGGDSKRVPQYSVCGKLFSPVPRQLPNGCGSTLFDEFVIGMSGVPARMKEGMLVLSGDVLLLFHPLQIDFTFRGAAAISAKEDVRTGKNHGVFLGGADGKVHRFLHKQTEEQLRSLGAVNSQDNVDLDTGAVVFDSELLWSLYRLISRDGVHTDKDLFDMFVNEESRISFYGDFLYPLATEATLEQYYKEAAEGTINAKLLECRRQIWDAIHFYEMKLIRLSPAKFLHFGTTGELMKLMVQEIEKYSYLGWSGSVVCNQTHDLTSAYRNSYVDDEAQIEPGCYLEDSCVLDRSVIGAGTILSGVTVTDTILSGDVVLHGLPLRDGRFVVRIYGLSDNPKGTLESGASFLHTDLAAFLTTNQLQIEDLWKENGHYLWNADLFPIGASMDEALEYALLVRRMAEAQASPADIERFLQADRCSLASGFYDADALALLQEQRRLTDRILTDRFLKSLSAGMYYRDALKIFGTQGITESIAERLVTVTEEAEFSLVIRIYYALYAYCRDSRVCLAGKSADEYLDLCFSHIQRVISEHAALLIPMDKSRIAKEFVSVELPVRVNWGGGWTDTPPHCIEQGGVVLNAAIRLNGMNPVHVQIERLENHYVEFVNNDNGSSVIVTELKELQHCSDPSDPFALFKASLAACGVIPLTGQGDLDRILNDLGGGIRMTTEVSGIPQGSGLGTSSVLAAACVKALYEFLGRDTSDDDIYEIVSAVEQIMSTGGGWQDQVGGLAPGIKMITTEPGIEQHICVTPLQMNEAAKQELEDRFVLIYTGQRRLAKNLLRDVVGGYLGARADSVYALREMKTVAYQMQEALENGDIDRFGALFDVHWELSKQLDIGSTNTCIDQIFLACDDLIDGRFIAGAGGGGFLQAILKPGVSKEQLNARIHEVFQDSGVEVWDSEFAW